MPAMNEMKPILDGDPFLPEGWTIGPERGSIDFPDHHGPYVPGWSVTEAERRRYLPFHHQPLVAEVLAEADLSITVDRFHRPPDGAL